MASLTRSARLLRTLIVGACVLPLVQACGRSEPGDYLYNSDGTISIAASSGTGGDSSTGGTRNTTGGSNGRGGISTGGTRATGGAGVGTSGSATTVGGTGSGGTGSGGTGAGGTGKGGTGQGGSGVAGSAQAGTGSAGSPGNPVTCGKDVCDSSVESFCDALARAECINKGQACGGAVLGCTLNSDCPGDDICCISITGSVDAASSCKARCDSTGNGRDRQLCQTADECVAPFRFCTPTIFGVSVCTRRP